MIKPICFKCKKELEEKGGILLSPPYINRSLNNLQSIVNGYDCVFKFHLCVECYSKVFTFISNIDG